MARCRATYVIHVTPKTRLELACDLDEGHGTLFRNHYDSLNKLEWLHREDPVPVPATRTTPPKKLRAAAVLSSASDRTGSFEVIRQ